MNLERYEADSALWLKLSEYVRGRIASMQTRLEGDLDPVATARTRGQIKAFRELLALADPPAQVTSD
jgi:hypothetical protein